MKIKHLFTDLHKDSKKRSKICFYVHLCVCLHLPVVMHKPEKSAST